MLDIYTKLTRKLEPGGVKYNLCLLDFQWWIFKPDTGQIDPITFLLDFQN